jgi:hypothetical protein
MLWALVSDLVNSGIELAIIKELDKGKSSERMRRKATGLKLKNFSMIAGLPERQLKDNENLRLFFSGSSFEEQPFFWASSSGSRRARLKETCSDPTA